MLAGALLPLAATAAMAAAAVTYGRRRIRRFVACDRASSQGSLLVIESVLAASIVLVSVAWQFGLKPSPTPDSGSVDDLRDLAHDGLFAVQRNPDRDSLGDTAVSWWITDAINGQPGRLEARLDRTIGTKGIEYHAFMHNGIASLDLVGPNDIQGPRESATIPFTSNWSWIPLVPAFRVVSPEVPLDLASVPIRFSMARELPGAVVSTRLTTSGVDATALRAISVTDRGYQASDEATRLSLAAAGGSEERTWAWAIDSLTPRRADIDLHVEGRVPVGAVATITAPPGWLVEIAPVDGWATQDGNPGRATRESETVDLLRLRITAPPDPLDAHQLLHVSLSNGAAAEADFVLVTPGAEAALDSGLVVNSPYPLRPGYPARFSMAYLNGAAENRTLEQLRFEVTEGIFDTTTAPTITVAAEGAPVRTFPGQLTNDGRYLYANFTAVSASYLGGQYWDYSDPTGLPQLRPAAGITTILVDAQVVATDLHRSAPVDERAGVHLTFPTGFNRTATQYGQEEGIFWIEVPPASAAGEDDGYPWLAAGGAQTIAADSPYLAKWATGSAEYRTVATDPTGLVTSRLLAYRDAYRDSRIVVLDDRVPLGGTVTLDTQLDSLLNEILALHPGQSLEDLGVSLQVALYPPATRGLAPSLVLDTPTATVSALSPFRGAAPFDLATGRGVVLVGGSTAFGLDGATGQVVWKAPLESRATDLAAWDVGNSLVPAPRALVAHERGLSLLAPDGTFAWNRSLGFVAERVATHELGGLKVAAVAGDGHFAILDAAGAFVVAPTTLDAAGADDARSIAQLAWASDATLLVGGGADGNVVKRITFAKPGTSWVASVGPARDHHGAGAVLALSGDASRELVTTVTRSSACAGSCSTVAVHDTVLATHADVLGDANTEAIVAGADGFVYVLDRTTVVKTIGLGAQTSPVPVTTEPCEDPFWGGGVLDGGGCPDVAEPRPGLWYEGASWTPSVALGTITPTALAVHATPTQKLILVAYVHAGESIVAAFDAATAQKVWSRTLGSGTGVAVNRLVSDGAGTLYVTTLDGSVHKWAVLTTPVETWAQTAGDVLGSYRHTITTPLGGFYGTHVAIATLAWNDLVLQERQEARLLTTFDLVQPDGRDATLVYTIGVEVWWPDDASG